MIAIDRRRASPPTLAGNANTASTSTDNTVTWDVVAPTVTINQAAGQADPTNASPINFTVVFSEAVTNFATGDVTLAGTAGGTHDGHGHRLGTTYNVAVTGMTATGTVIASIAAGVATDAAGNGNTASTAPTTRSPATTSRPTVTINQAAGQADPTNTSPDQLHRRLQRAGHRLRRPATSTFSRHGGRDEDRAPSPAAARPTTSRSPA